MKTMLNNTNRFIAMSITAAALTLIPVSGAFATDDATLGTSPPKAPAPTPEGGPIAPTEPTADIPTEPSADFNGDASITVQDMFSYLVAYFSGSAAADANQDGVISRLDVLEFLEMWFAAV